MYTYRCKLVRVVDGDTIILDIDLGFHISIQRSVRLLGYNSPEIFGAKKSEASFQAGIECKQELERVLGVGKKLFCVTELDKSDKYGRILAKIFENLSDSSINEHMTIFVQNRTRKDDII